MKKILKFLFYSFIFLVVSFLLLGGLVCNTVWDGARQAISESLRKQTSSKWYEKSLGFDSPWTYEEAQSEPVKLFYPSGAVKIDCQSADTNFFLNCKGYTESGEPAHGLIKAYYPSGTLESEFNYEQGTPQGPFKVYGESGTLSMEGVFKNGNLEGTAKEYYPSGKLEQETIVQGKSTDGGLILEVRNYWDYGPLNEVVHLKNGRIEGPFSEYYPSGKVRFEANYKNGTVEGEFKGYYESGELKMDGNASAAGDGSVVEYYPSGKLKIEYEVKARKPEGDFKEYYESGQLKVHGIFKDGKTEGLVTEYDETGGIVEQSLYENGRFIREGTNLSPNP